MRAVFSFIGLPLTHFLTGVVELKIQYKFAHQKKIVSQWSMRVHFISEWWQIKEIQGQKIRVLVKTQQASHEHARRNKCHFPYPGLSCLTKRREMTTALSLQSLAVLEMEMVKICSMSIFPTMHQTYQQPPITHSDIRTGHITWWSIDQLNLTLCFSSSAFGPIPDSMRRWGELIADADTITSLFANTLWTSPPSRTNDTPTARLPSIST